MVTYSGSKTFAPKIYLTLEGRIIKETPKAILFSVVNKDTFETIQQDWFPKSQISSYGGAYDEIDGTFNFILASEWILKEKGLITHSVNHMQESKDNKKPLTSGINSDSIQDKKQRAEFKDDEQDIIPPADDDYWKNYGV